MLPLPSLPLHLLSHLLHILFELRISVLDTLIFLLLICFLRSGVVNAHSIRFSFLKADSSVVKCIPIVASRISSGFFFPLCGKLKLCIN